MERQQSDGRAMDHSPKPSAEAIREAYSSKIAVLETEKDSLKRKSGLCLAGKLFFFAAAVVFICFAVSSVSFRDIAFSVLSAALYIVSYIADSRLRDRISRLESLQKTCRNELAYLDGDFTPFGKGEEYADPDHEYACDLELAGLADKDPGLYRNLCFEIGLSEDICYTYKIQDGVARNLNASYLLSRILNTDRDKTSPENQETYGNE